MRRVLRARLLAAGCCLGGPLTGCPQVCEGPGCEDLFDGAIVGVLSGAELPESGEADPTDRAFAVEGGVELGPSLTAVLTQQWLLVASLEESSVRSFDARTGGAQAALDSAAVLRGETASDGFGASLAVVPDLDGDGVAELLVGASLRDVSNTSRNDGAVYLLSGLGAGFDADQAVSDAVLRVSGEQVAGHLGEVTAGCADIDGDGLGDFLVAAPWGSREDGHGIEEVALSGAVWPGLSDGLGELESQVLAGALGDPWTGASVGARAGAALSCAHDVTNDGTADVLIGAPFEDDTEEAQGAVYVIAGGASLARGNLEEVAMHKLVGRGAQAWLGWSLTSADLDGDGFAEIISGSPGVNDEAGQVLIWEGEGFATTGDLFSSFRIGGASAGDALGRAVAAADLDGDALPDLLIGAPKRNPLGGDLSGYDSGALYLFSGASDFAGWRITMDTLDAVVTWSVAEPYLRTGQSIATGDYDGDGQGDVALVHRYEP